jgi:hypothetical protein
MIQSIDRVQVSEVLGAECAVLGICLCVVAIAPKSFGSCETLLATVQNGTIEEMLCYLYSLPWLVVRRKHDVASWAGRQRRVQFSLTKSAVLKSIDGILIVQGLITK